MRKKKVCWVGLSIFVLGTIFLTNQVAFGQAVSQISGTVTDSSGAVVPGVEVLATQTETGIKRQVTTNSLGEYVLPNLQIGPYHLEAVKDGFRKFVQTGIQLQVNSNPAIPITLVVGQLGETIEVQANATQVETQKLGIGSVMESQRILELPLNGRQPTDLITLTGAAVQTGVSPTFSMNTGVRIAVAGGLDFGVYYALDGAPHLNLYDTTNMPLPFPDALQEFKVDTSTQDAQTGTHSGAQVNAVTKSGTNAFHGDAFEFLRNGAVNARNYFSAIPDNLKRNQFGGVIGGPVIKNRIFVFAGYQGTTVRQTPAPTTTFVPTPAMLTGDFSVFASATCQGTARTLRTPFTTISGKPNQLPAASLSPVASKLATFLPAAQDSCGRYQSYSPISTYEWQVPVRMDAQLTDKQNVFFRYLATKQTQVVPHQLNPANVLIVGNNGVDDLATSATAGHTWLLNSRMVNSFRASLNRVSLYHFEDTYFGPQELGINAFTYTPKTIIMIITGGPTIGAGTGLNKRAGYTYLSANDDFNIIKGSHQLSFGANLMRSVVNSSANAFSSGQYTVNGQSTGLGWGDVFAGQVSLVRQQLPNPLHMYHWFGGSYVQDTWKVSPRLTVNAGIRWEPFRPMQIIDNSVYTFDMQRFLAGTVSKIWTNAPPGLYYPGDAGFNGKSGINGKWTNFQPRLGVAWDPFGDGKTSIRAGAGIAYDFFSDSSYQNLVSAAPFLGQTTVTGPVPLANPWGTTPGGNPFPFTSIPPTGKFPVGGAYLPVPPDFKTTQVQTWNLTLQRQLTPALFVSAGYLGNHALHLPTQVELNPGVLLNVPSVLATDSRCNATTIAVNCTANLQTRRALVLQNPALARPFGNVSQYDDGATSVYNGLLLSSTWRQKSTMMINANYTWSHCVGDQTLGNNVVNSANNYPHQNNRRLDRGECAQDRRHLFNLTVVGRSPKFANRSTNRLAGGWTLSGIYRYQSPAPVTLLSGLDQALTGFNATERPDQVTTNTASLTRGAACPGSSTACVSWLNPSAFAQPALGTLGNTGAQNILGPRFFQFDVSLVREFRIVEGQSLQVRAEAFNLLNSTRLNPLNIVNNQVNNNAVTLNNPLFGQITNAFDPRILQLALKYTF